MTDQIHLRIICISSFSIMAKQFGSFDHFIHKYGKMGFDYIQWLPPVIPKRKNWYGLVFFLAQVITQFLNNFLIGNIENVIRLDAAGSIAS